MQLREKNTPLNINIDQKNQAKKTTSPDGKTIFWDPKKKEWLWPGPEDSVPTPLKPFLYPGEGEIQDFVLTANTEDYNRIKKNPPTSGRIRWEESLQRGVWRGKSLPKPLLIFQGETNSFEALASILLNQTEKKREKDSPEIQILESFPTEKHILLDSGTSTKSTLFTLDFENANWILPWRDNSQLKNPFQNKLPPLVIQSFPEFSPRSQKASELMAVLNQAPILYFIAPQKPANPIQSFVCLPIWTKLYHKKLTLKDFPKILKAFKIKTTGSHFNPKWTPSENDEIYFQTLFKP